MQLSLDLGALFGALSAVTAGVWAIRQYLGSRRTQRAEWLQRVFTDFYFNPEYGDIKQKLEYGDFNLAPLLQRRVTDRHLRVEAREDQITLTRLDALLNALEFLLYLEEQNHLAESDRRVLFEYWLELLRWPEHSTLRRYIARFGFERLSRVVYGPAEQRLLAGGTEHVAVYGSLASCSAGQTEAGVLGALRMVGACGIPGRLYDLGDYPGLVPGEEMVEAELYSFTDFDTLHKLDQFERFDPSAPATSLFVRRSQWIPDRQIDAWVYFWNRPIGSEPRIPANSWIRSATRSPELAPADPPLTSSTSVRHQMPGATEP